MARFWNQEMKNIMTPDSKYLKLESHKFLVRFEILAMFGREYGITSGYLEPD